MDDTHDLQTTPASNDVLHAPWRIEHDEDYGIGVIDNRGYLVWIDDFDDKSISHREEVTARMHAVVRVVNAHADMLAALKRAIALADECLVDFSDGRTPDCEQSYNLCVAAIAKAEAGTTREAITKAERGAEP